MCTQQLQQRPSAEQSLLTITTRQHDARLQAAQGTTVVTGLCINATGVARYNTWLLTKSTPKGVVFSFLSIMLPSCLLTFSSQKLLPGCRNSVFFACLCDSLSSSSSSCCFCLCINKFGSWLGSGLRRVPTFCCSCCRSFWSSC